MLTVYLVADDKTKPGQMTRCLDSISDAIGPQNYETVAGDDGTPREILDECLPYDIKWVPVRHQDGMDSCRNKLLAYTKNDWSLYVEPWEVLAQEDGLLDHVGAAHDPLSFVVIQGDTMTRQTRLWRKSKARFVGPVFERVDATGIPSNNIIVSEGGDTTWRDLSIAEDWVKRCPMIPDPYYYKACLHMSRAEYKKFLKDAETYLFMEQNPKAVVSVTMMRYYIACVECYYHKDPNATLSHLAACLLTEPLMAEFWCLLGDVYYHLVRQYGKAKDFYENAVILGSRRSSSSPYPMEISKYEDHPKTMIASCEKIIRSSSRIGKA